MKKSFDFEKHTVYNAAVNIELFNNLIAFIIETTTETDTTEALETLSRNHLWYEYRTKNNIRETYDVRYLGELLERYKERVSDDLRDFRAIALALAYSKALVTKDMIIGRQLDDFIKEVKSRSGDDIYLNGALYVFDTAKYESCYLKLTASKQKSTEELIFMLSLTNDAESSFETFKPQLLELIGKDKTVSPIDNIGIYSWFIAWLHPFIKNLRKKDCAIFKALTTLPTGFIHEKSPAYATLTANSYSIEEIAYMNYCLMTTRPIPGTVAMHTLLAEKIAVALCEVFINSSQEHTDATYELLTNVIELFGDFNVKYCECKSIIDVLVSRAKPGSPKTFIWLYKTIGRDYIKRPIFQFDVLDSKWDALAANITGEAEYLRLFDKQFQKQTDTETIHAYLAKYTELTEQSYLDSFHSHYYDRDSAFKFVVEHGLLNMQELYANAKEVDNSNKNEKRELEYIADYIYGIPSKEAFLFLRFFFKELNASEFTTLHRKLDNCFDNMYRSSRYYNSRDEGEIQIKRSFLSDAEHRELFEWLEAYFFFVKPNEYIEFIAAALKNEFIVSIFSDEERRQVFDTLRECRPDLVEDDSRMKKLCLTEDELEEERIAETQKEAEKKRLAEEKKMLEFEKECAEHYDGTCKSIHNFIKKHYFREKDVTNVAWKQLQDMLLQTKCVITSVDFPFLLKLLARMSEEKVISVDMALQHIAATNIFKEETIDETGC